MKCPGSAADKPVLTEKKTGDIMVLVGGQTFMMSKEDALSLAGIIIATVTGTLRNGR